MLLPPPEYRRLRRSSRRTPRPNIVPLVERIEPRLLLTISFETLDGIVSETGTGSAVETGSFADLPSNTDHVNISVYDAAGDLFTQSTASVLHNQNGYYFVQTINVAQGVTPEWQVQATAVDASGNVLDTSGVVDIGVVIQQDTPAQLAADVNGFTLSGPIGRIDVLQSQPIFTPSAPFVEWYDNTSSQTSLTKKTDSHGVTYFEVDATHTYAEEGDYRIGLEGYDGAYFPSVTTFAVGSPDVTVTLTPGLLSSLKEGASIGGIIAKFTDPDDPVATGDYEAVIDWGDQANSMTTVNMGTTGANRIQEDPDGQSFDIYASFTYPEETPPSGETFQINIFQTVTSGGTPLTVQEGSFTTPFTVADAALTAGSLTTTGGVEGVTPTTSAPPSPTPTSPHPPATSVAPYSGATRPRATSPPAPSLAAAAATP